MESNGEVYDPEQHLRGIVLPEAKEKDRAGRASKQQVFGLRLQLTDGYVSLLYGFLRGLPWMNLEQTTIEIPFEGLVKLNGKWRRIDGDWLATVKGQRLEAVFDQINEAKRVSLHRSTGSDSGEAQVDKVSIEELEIEE